jgi:hypothetical protein
MDHILPILPNPTNHRLETSFFTEELLAIKSKVLIPQQWITQGIAHCQHFEDLVVECEQLHFI